MPKAIVITTANINTLMTQYDLEEEVLIEAVGLYLVADFGDSTPTYGYLTLETFDENFTMVFGNEPLKNGFVEVEKKS